jgi:exo-1,4-beta-D-glucosaminidase
MRTQAYSLLAGALLLVSVAPLRAAQVTPLKDGWSLQSACKATDAGAAISSANYHPHDWTAASVPSTVVAAQVAAGEFKNIFYGDNLRSLPGMTYPIGENFSNLPMSADSPYHCGWWYRKEISVPAQDRAANYALQFDGVNYSAEVWLNGERIADRSQVQGAYRTYEFDVTRLLRPGAKNVLAVQVFAPTEKSLGINWVDWNPMPPDKEMGLWGDVRLVANGVVKVRNAAVFTHFPDSSLHQAALTVTADVSNTSHEVADGQIEADLMGVHVAKRVRLQPGETQAVTLTPADFPQLTVNHPQVWWPADFGAQPLQSAIVRFVGNGRVSDQEQVHFGIREITSELTPEGHRLFRVNGKPILIRGGGWSQDMLLRTDHKRLEHEFELVRDLHLNTIRLEGKMENEDFFRLADERGILVMAGWCCCDFWEHWGEWNANDLDVAARSLDSQVKRLRSHPSLLTWLYGSDNPPPAEVERRYLEVFRDDQWPNPVISSASATPTSLTGPSGVKMSGPYDYVAPSYWYQDVNRFGGAYGFNTETSPGPSPDSVAELSRFLPAKSFWPPDNPVFDYHAGGEGFKNLGVFNRAMTEMFGPSNDMDTYSKIGQAMEYDSERAMFESYSGHRFVSTGVVQWMLNNAWPSLIWHLYDYSLVPNGSYYGVKKANEPLHIQYAYDEHAVYVVNSSLSDSFDMEATVEVFSPALEPVFKKTVPLARIPGNASTFAVAIPDTAFRTNVQFNFVRLTLAKGGGVTVTRNFYWIPTTLTTFDWNKTDYTHTPALKSAVLTDLRKLAPAKVDMSATVEGREIVAHLKNTSGSLAFQLQIEAVGEDGHLVPALFWNDNFIELMPNEDTVVSASIPNDYVGQKLVLRLSAWNMQASETALELKHVTAGQQR